MTRPSVPISRKKTSLCIALYSLTRNETITIDTSKSLQNQRIDDKTYEILETVLKAVDKNRINSLVDVENQNKEKVTQESMQGYVENCQKENELFHAQVEMVKLKGIITSLRNENTKIDEAKELMLKYQDVMKAKDEEIKQLKNKVENLERENVELVWLFKRIPSFLRKIFMKVDIKLME